MPGILPPRLRRTDLSLLAKIFPSNFPEGLEQFERLRRQWGLLTAIPCVSSAAIAAKPFQSFLQGIPCACGKISNRSLHTWHEVTHPIGKSHFEKAVFRCSCFHFSSLLSQGYPGPRFIVAAFLSQFPDDLHGFVVAETLLNARNENPPL